ncbi:MAG: hypothetical protein CVV24_13965, partial [Ignavibacteriae bacterium HGW-Ignavibacteriae-3]
KNQLEIALNPNPVWNINLNMGASKAIFDLSEFKVKNVEVNTGAAKGIIKLGDKNDSTNVRIEMGAASVTIEIPVTSGCSINSDMALSTSNFPGFKQTSSGNFETENFESAVKKILINVDGGLASMRIKRY